MRKSTGIDLKDISLGNISQTDRIIALMGPTGVGKSTFIDIATGQNGSTIGHALQSCTKDVRSVRVPHPVDGRPFVFVDTPGFDDTKKSDTEVLKMIAEWLEKTYKKSVKLAGIIYLHRISDNRMSGSPLKNLRVFANLCGNDAIQNVILATTMWSRVQEDVGARREKELQGEYWKSMLDNGSRTMRFMDTSNSAWDIVNSMTQKDAAQSLLIQEEMVDLHKRLSETQAGITLYNALKTLLENQTDAVRKLREQAEIHKDELIIAELNAQYAETQDKIRQTFDQIQEMKIPLHRRIRLFFTFGKPDARPVTIS